ncbi:threonine-phosphate decarboxylase [Gluconacetobacter diazotrophicus]|uniref:threonine-phosphate decarboxylase n=1 Tax=Gluconacetobacter diazotrophicus TaxID=33996 RepID=A0A7W4NGE4_GLUDI|nr:threonine-phosphate decarboxylase CobD [Gluconacetobacter diazotrophicus]MBB2157259.1 threonine-phosphate decarboxylase [Gluconacetobacter diazotrophicus]
MDPMPAHGGQVRAVMRAFPDAPAPFVDLSTGISPYAYPFAMPDGAALTRLPERDDEDRLRRVAAEAYGVADPECIAAGPGTQMLIALLPFLLGPRAVTILGPTYGGHADAWRGAGARIHEVTGMQDLEDAAAVPGGVCVVCNPNNPDGRVCDAAWLAALADRCASYGGTLIVDEAFADFESCSIAPLLPHPGLIVLRSFGKSYGLPGVRLGFALAAPALAGRLRDIMGAWAVGTLALAAGRQALADRPWRDATRGRVRADAARLARCLAREDIEVAGQSTLFVLARAAQAPSLWRFLCQRGLVTRAFPERPSWLRLGLPRRPDEWTRLEQALSAWRPA